MADNLDAEVEVMYKDLSRKKETLENIHLLPKDDVLFIAVWVPDVENKDKLRRLTESFNFDHYALCVRKWDSADWILLSGWNDGDFVWRRTKSPFIHGSRLEANPPLGCFHVVFNGVSVPPKIWEKAQKIFNKKE